MVSQSPEKYAAEPESSGVHAIQLVQSDCAWNGKLYSQYPSGQPCLTVMKMTIEAHTTLPWHTHSMPNAAFIISGQLTVEDRNTGKTRVINAGEAFNEAVDDIHRGYTTHLPAEIIITYAGVVGQALSNPVSIEE